MHRVTLICDSCEKQYIIDDAMELPPYWFSAQIVIANGDGLIPVQDRETYLHFCSQTCLADYAKGKTLKNKKLTIDKQFEDDKDES